MALKSLGNLENEVSGVAAEGRYFVGSGVSSVIGIWLLILVRA